MNERIQKRSPTRAATFAFLALLGFTQASVAQNCESYENYSDESINAQARLCNTHVGCRYILNTYKSCPSAFDFLQRLKYALDINRRPLEGADRRITADQIFEAHISENQAKATWNDEAKQFALRAREFANAAPDRETLGTLKNGIGWAYYGAVKDGVANGAGVFLFSHGEIQRGQFLDGNPNGASDILFFNGSRHIGVRTSGKPNGRGVFQFNAGSQYLGGFLDGKFDGQGSLNMRDGRRFSGLWSNNTLIDGAEYRADGIKISAGRYDGNEKLIIGERFNASGQVIERLDGREQERVVAQTQSPRPAPSPVTDDPKVMGGGARPR
jgi:hypothetical protein